MNYLKTFGLMLGLMALFLLVGRAVGGAHGMLLALLFASVMNISAYWFSDRAVLAMHRAREVGPNDEPRLTRVVQRLANAGGLPMPRVFVIDDDAPNAFATGRNLSHAAVAASTGILDLLTPTELEGVIAHELSHIKHRDMLTGTIVAVLAGTIMFLADQLRWAAMFGGLSRRDDDREGGGLGLLFVMLVAPVAAFLIQMAVSRSREYAADEGAAALTGNPGALARALEKIHARIEGEAPLAAATPAMAHLYIANPFGAGGVLRALFSTHPPVERRIRRLEAIETGRIRPVF